MSNDSQKNPDFQSLPSSQQLAQEKIEAREKLISLPPSIAQKQVDQVLYPELWEFNIQSHSYEESIPTNYGEIDT